LRRTKRGAAHTGKSRERRLEEEVEEAGEKEERVVEEEKKEKERWPHSESQVVARRVHPPPCSWSSVANEGIPKAAFKSAAVASAAGGRHPTGTRRPPLPPSLPPSSSPPSSSSSSSSCKANKRKNNVIHSKKALPASETSSSLFLNCFLLNLSFASATVNVTTARDSIILPNANPQALISINSSTSPTCPPGRKEGGREEEEEEEG